MVGVGAVVSAVVFAARLPVPLKWYHRLGDESGDVIDDVVPPSSGDVSS